MEPEFVCEFPFTVPMIAARIRKYSDVRWAVQLVLGIGFFSYILVRAILSAAMHMFDFYWVQTLFLSLVILLFSIFFPQINAFFAVRNYKKNTSGKGLYKISFGEKIELSQGAIQSTLDYSAIQKVYRLKYSYELVISKHSAVVVDPKGFTKGDFESFREFLKSKRPDLNLPK